MNKVIYEVSNELATIEEHLKNIDEFMKEAPVGCLCYKNIKDKIYYYQQVVDSQMFDLTSKSDKKQLKKAKKKKIKMSSNNLNNNSDNAEKKSLQENIQVNIISDSKVNSKIKKKQTYIKKKDIWLAETLAQKAYFITIKPLLEKQRELLLNFLKNYKVEYTTKAYDDMTNARKLLVKPFAIGKEEAIRQWNEEVYTVNEYHSENKIFDTMQGEKVRSKSEMIIANMLYEYRADILYKYERPIDIVKNMSIGRAFPDFTILNKHTGKITYWEHAGCMDNAVYANDFIKKLNNYALNDIVFGKNLVATYESREHPLDMTTVRNTIKSLL